MPGFHPADPLSSLTELDVPCGEQSVSTDCGGDIWPSLSVAIRTVRKDRFGGDFQFSMRGPGQRYSLILGTVSGSGIIANLAKTGLSKGIHPYGPTLLSTTELIRRLDGVLTEINTGLKNQQVGCSVFLAVVDRAEGIIECCRVGHARAFLRFRSGQLLEIPSAGPRLGSAAGVRGPSDMFELPTLERLVVCSEGVLLLPAERPLAAETAWLRSIVSKSLGQPLETQLDSLVDAVYSHCQPVGGPARDVTFFGAEFTQEKTIDPQRTMSEWVRACRRLGRDAADPSIFLG